MRSLSSVFLMSLHSCATSETRESERLPTPVTTFLQGPIRSYERFGFGLYLAELKNGGIPIGICGLLKREALADVDIGFAFLPQFWKKGYAFESATAVMAYGRDIIGIN